MSLLHLERTLQAPTEARRQVADVLPRQLRPGQRNDILLLVSELVTHQVGPESPQPLKVRVGVESGTVEVWVSDPGRVLTTSDEFGPRMARRLLERLTDEWGSDEEGVWFRLTAAASLPPTEWSDEELFASRDTDPSARHLLFERHQGLAIHLARRMGRRSDREDLAQVAAIGLVKAIDRFDTSVGVAFTTYASRTIIGEIKRHFRDHSWSVRVPRGLKESALRVRKASAELEQELGRAPSVEELARRCDLEADEVIEALQATDALSATSLDAPLSDEEDARSPASFLGDVDPEMEVAEGWQFILPALEKLPERERRILALRFFEDMTQSEIAEEVGISQMHVSRLLRRSLEQLRQLLE